MELQNHILLCELIPAAVAYLDIRQVILPCPTVKWPVSIVIKLSDPIKDC